MNGFQIPSKGAIIYLSITFYSKKSILPNCCYCKHEITTQIRNIIVRTLIIRISFDYSACYVVNMKIWSL